MRQWEGEEGGGSADSPVLGPHSFPHWSTFWLHHSLQGESRGQEFSALQMALGSKRKRDCKNTERFIYLDWTENYQ